MNHSKIGQNKPPANGNIRERRKHPVRNRLLSLGGVAAGAVMSVTGAGVAVTDSVPPPPDKPVVRVFDPSIVWTDNPQVTASRQADNLELKQECMNSKFLTIDFSGTGMETSHYSAGLKNASIKKLGGCSLYLWYGQKYDNDANVEAIETAVEELTLPGQSKKVIFRAASFGGIAAEAAAAHPTIKDSKVIDLAGIIMEDSPHDMEDVEYSILGVPFREIAKYINFAELPYFIEHNHLGVVAAAVKGQNDMGKIGNQTEWGYTWNNIKKTWPPLMWSELAGIDRGMVDYNPAVPVVYMQSNIDDTVNGTQAIAKIQQAIPKLRVVHLAYEGLAMKHAPSWLSEAQPYSSSSYEEETKALLDGTVR